MSRIINEKQTNVAMRCTDVSQFRVVAGIDPPPEDMVEVKVEPQHRGGLKRQTGPPPDPVLKEQLEKGWEFLQAAAKEKDAVQTESGLVYLETAAGTYVHKQSAVACVISRSF